MAWLRGLSAAQSPWVRRSKCEYASLPAKLFFSGDCELPSLPEPDEDAGSAAAGPSGSSFGREGAAPGAFGRLGEVAAPVGAKPRIHHRRFRILPDSGVHVGVLLDVDAANTGGISMTLRCGQRQHDSGKFSRGASAVCTVELGVSAREN